jgi:hypothetical protein
MNPNHEPIKSLTQKEELQLLRDIISRMYVARNITLNSEAVQEQLRNLDNYHNLLNDDHNGEYSDRAMRAQKKRGLILLREKMNQRIVQRINGIEYHTKKYFEGSYYDRSYTEYYDINGKLVYTTTGNYA